MYGLFTGRDSSIAQTILRTGVLSGVLALGAKLNMQISPETAEPIPRLATLINDVPPALPVQWCCVLG